MTDEMPETCGSARNAYEQLVSRFGGYVYTIVLSKLGGLGSREDIEDCVSDVFVEVYSSMEKFSGEKGSLRAFVGSIAKRRAIDAFRRLSYRQSVTVPADDENTGSLPSSEDTSRQAEENILRKKLWDSVKSLGQPDRDIILFQYFYRMQTGEIARKLGMSPAAVQKRSQRARKKLKSILSDEI